MKLKTTRFGEIEVDEVRVLTFPQGLYGFGHSKRYVILEHNHETPFLWLQSLEYPELAFVVLNPQLFITDYRIKVSREDISLIEPTDEKSLLVLVIATITEEPTNITANLLGPLVINLKNRKGMQIVLSERRYKTNYPILPELKRIAREGINTPQITPTPELTSLSLTL